LFGKDTPVGIERDKAAILDLYETTRRGHLEGDAALLLAQYAPQWDDLRSGSVVARTIDGERARIAGQLTGMRYLAWDDVAPPRVEVSADGTMAWLLGEIRARAVQTLPDGSEREIAYRCAWLQVYARRDGRWEAIVNAPLVQLESE
jgi:hypothetical protein